MCGIVGQVRNDGRPVDRDRLVAMCRALEHRGPDSRGTFRDDGAGLGIQRLRVIDLATGDQPIYNEDRSAVVVLNGEIYNYRQLRAELERRGHRFATQGDTEVIVHLYEEHGSACVSRLHGMFAFALWDRRRKRLLLARDRVGKKPLFYALRRGALSFASELGALLQDPEISRDVDHAAIDAFLARQVVPGPLSAFREVRKLPPAHRMIWQDGRVMIERYWRLDYQRQPPTTDPRELGERIRDAIRTAVRRRLVADVPLGAFLSGGIDSSAVVAAMAEESSQRVRTFSIGFDREAFDELPHARQIAERFDTDHREFTVQPDALALLPKIVRHYGEPFADPSAIPSFHLAALTREHVTVALNGDGGDESFAGYTRYVANLVAGRFDRLPLPLRRGLAGWGARLGATGDVASLRNKLRRLTSSLALEPRERYARYQTVMPHDQRRALYTDDYVAAIGSPGAPDELAAAWDGSTARELLDVMLDVDVQTYLPDDLLAKIDIATMAYGLEARSPFLDHELMELAASLPASVKILGMEKKWILREALRPWLPTEVLDRPKQGFCVPVGDWFRHELRDYVRDVLLDPSTLARGYFREQAVQAMLDRHDAGVDAEDRRIWMLLMLELWHRECVDAPLALPAAA